MKRHYQTKFGEGKGNCFQYALASILDLEPEDVPDFCNEYGDDWHEETVKWLNQYGLSAIYIQPFSKELNAYYFKDCTLLISVKSDNGVNHVAIYKNGELIHDPNFWNEGKYKVEAVALIFPMNPALHVKNGKAIK